MGGKKKEESNQLNGKMTVEILTLSPANKYKILSTKSGGMGKILLLEKIKDEKTEKKSLTYEGVLSRTDKLKDKFKYIYREFLVAKTVKDPQYNDLFIRELNIWINFSDPGSVPLLKVHKEDGQLYAIMPFYQGNLREVLETGTYSYDSIIRSLSECFRCLQNIHRSHQVVHLDLKPENILVDLKDNLLEFRVSDWGISNLKSTTLGFQRPSELREIVTLVGAGTLPYMAPERIRYEKPDIQSDLFSMGVIVFETIFKQWPYEPNKDIAEQLVSNSYFEFATSILRDLQNRPLKELTLGLLHPDKKKRISDYSKALKYLKSI